MSVRLCVLVDANTNPSILGIVEPESHRRFRERPWDRENVCADTRVSGFSNTLLDAGVPEDNEENAVRLVTQMVREAFARLRQKGAL